jgi:23S rRNA (cytidine1920-2'-O)/16S rRNA (cytidine1409-2'-O)-methyltransferase
MATGTRLDNHLVDRGLAETRSRAKALILAGDVIVNGQRETRAGQVVGENDTVSLKQTPRFVSRGGEKLDRALDAFGIDATGMVAADLGASTGGFTDCLLQRGVARVYAVDVGHGQLDLRVRGDQRVVVLEKTNARFLEALPEAIDLVVIDVSFISLSLIFPVAARLLKPGGRCVPLVKPQFEVGRGDVGKGGVVRDPAMHRLVLARTTQHAEDNGFGLVGLVVSPLQGPAGNIEFLADMRLGSGSTFVPQLIDTAMIEAAAVGGSV